MSTQICSTDLNVLKPGLLHFTVKTLKFLLDSNTLSVLTLISSQSGELWCFCWEGFAWFPSSFWSTYSLWVAGIKRHQFQRRQQPYHGMGTFTSMRIEVAKRKHLLLYLNFRWHHKIFLKNKALCTSFITQINSYDNDKVLLGFHTGRLGDLQKQCLPLSYVSLSSAQATNEQKFKEVLGSWQLGVGSHENCGWR